MIVRDLVMFFLPVAIIVIIVTPHSQEAWPLEAGDGIDFDADPSVSGVTT